ncbi:hypothetical protein ACJQWK_11274 [Exserohilum turcicum]
MVTNTPQIVQRGCLYAEEITTDQATFQGFNYHQYDKYTKMMKTGLLPTFLETLRSARRLSQFYTAGLNWLRTTLLDWRIQRQSLNSKAR